MDNGSPCMEGQRHWKGIRMWESWTAVMEGRQQHRDLGLDKGRWWIPAVITSQVDKQPCHETEQFPYTTLIHFEIRFSSCILENLKIKEKTINLCCSCFNSTSCYFYIHSLPAMLVPVAINMVLFHLLNLNIQQGASLAEYFLFQSENYTPLTNSVLWIQYYFIYAVRLLT